jgi:predicted nucleic acid-binding Zn ribbon protein
VEGRVVRRRDDEPGAGKPRAIAEALRDFLKLTGLDEDVARAGVMAAWPHLVGAQIASVTQPRLMTEDGTLVVGVKTHGWMQELTMMERQLLAQLASVPSPTPVQRIRWELLR